MDEFSSSLDTEVYTALSATDIHVFYLCTLREVLYYGCTVEYGVDG